MLNSFVVMGRLVADPIVDIIPNGKRKARFAIANTIDKERVSYFNIECWNEAVFPYLKKGKLVTVVGMMEIVSFQAKDGTTKKVDRVTANRIDLMDFFFKKEETTATAEAPTETTEAPTPKKKVEAPKTPKDFNEEDIPF